MAAGAATQRIHARTALRGISVGPNSGPGLDPVFPPLQHDLESCGDGATAREHQRPRARLPGAAAPALRWRGGGAGRAGGGQGSCSGPWPGPPAVATLSGALLRWRHSSGAKTAADAATGRGRAGAALRGISVGPGPCRGYPWPGPVFQLSQHDLERCGDGIIAREYQRRRARLRGEAAGAATGGQLLLRCKRCRATAAASAQYSVLLPPPSASVEGSAGGMMKGKRLRLWLRMGAHTPCCARFSVAGAARGPQNAQF